MDTYKRLLAYAPEKKHLAYLSVAFSFLSSVFYVLPYYFLYKFFVELILNGNVNHALLYALIIIGCTLLNLVCSFVSVWLTHILGFRLETNLRKVGAKRLLHASFAFFDTNQSGRIRKIIDDNAQNTHTVVAHLIPDTVSAIVTPVLMLILAFCLYVPFALWMVVVLVLAVINIKFMMGNTELIASYQKSLERLNSETVEYVRGMPVIKVFGATVRSFTTLKESIELYAKYAWQYTINCKVPFIIFQVIINIFIPITLPVVIYFVNKGLDPHFMMLNVVYFAIFGGVAFASLTRIMYVGMEHYQGMQTVENLENLFESMQAGLPMFGDETKFENSTIVFDNVSFKYDESYVLQNLSFTLPEKQTYALVGPSGGGKSTIARLISGFYGVDSGQILIGGKPTTAYTREALSAHIAFVFQQSQLFKMSIYDNVKLGNPQASYEQVMKALELARCNDILDKFVSREETVIGATGVHLSGGEVQRIAIARAILKDADIIILDEASAAADPENEYEIQQAFSNLMKNKTVIMIAHRLSSITQVDEILFIEDGKITERGSHETLMEEGHAYKNLVAVYEKALDWGVHEKAY